MNTTAPYRSFHDPLDNSRETRQARYRETARLIQDAPRPLFRALADAKTDEEYKTAFRQTATGTRLPRFMQRVEEAYHASSTPTIAAAWTEQKTASATLEARYTDGTRQTLTETTYANALPCPSEYVGLTPHQATRQLIRDLMNPEPRTAA